MVDAVGLLAETFPDLAVRTVEELAEGWDHVAYLVNRDLVFRLPWAVVDGTGGAPRANADDRRRRAGGFADRSRGAAEDCLWFPSHWADVGVDGLH